MLIKTSPTITQGYWIRRAALASALLNDLRRIGKSKFSVDGESAYSGWISGGFKEHWPEAFKRRMRTLNQRIAHYEDKAWFWRPKYQRFAKFLGLVRVAELEAADDVLLARLQSHK